jgi:hypothetical protein
MIDPNPNIAAAGIVDAPTQPSEDPDNPDPNTSGQTIDGNGNIQITGSNTTVFYPDGHDSGSDNGVGGDSGGSDGGGGRLEPRSELAVIVLALFIAGRFL